MAQPLTTPTSIEALLESGVIGSIAAGRYTVQFHAEHGAIVFLNPPESPPAPRPLADEPAPRPETPDEGPTLDAATAQQELAPLPDEEKRVLSALAAVGGGPLTLPHLAALADVEDPRPALNALLERKLVLAHGSRYRLRGDLETLLSSIWDLSPWCERALAYFLLWAEARREDPAALLEEAGVLRRLLDWAAESGRHAEALRLGRALDAALGVSGRWSAWAQALTRVRVAAEALQDRAAEGWALHQLGSRLLCLDDQAAARPLLSHALAIRKSLGDRDGAAVTRHNLGLLGPLPASRVWPYPIPIRLLPWLALAVLVLVFAGLRLWSSRIGTSTRGVQTTVVPISSDQEPPPAPTPVPPVAIEESSDLTTDQEAAEAAPLPLATDATSQETSRPLLEAPASVELPTVALGSPSATSAQTIAISNAGKSPLLIAGVSFTANSDRAFTARSNCINSSLAPKQRCTIQILFHPTKAGSHSATLAIDAEGRERRTVELSGEATESRTTTVEPPRTPSTEPAPREPATTSEPPEPGWCCAGGDVALSSQAECTGRQGRFFRMQRAAVAACLLTGCCVDGDFKLGEKRDQCKEQGGTFMSAAEVSVRCHQQQDGWCCLPGGNLVQISRNACERGKGDFFESKTEAQRQCTAQ